jgi:hypothetical protein
MGVVAVACVAVMNGQALGPMGRLHHHKSDRAVPHNRRVAGMDFVDEETLSGTPGLTFSNAQLGLAGLLKFPKFAADASDDGGDPPAAGPNIGFGRPVSGAGVIARPQAAPTPPPGKPPQDPPPPEPPQRPGAPPLAQWVDAAVTPDNPVPPVTPDPPAPPVSPVIVVTPVVVITPPVSPPPPDLPLPELQVTRLAAAPPPAPIPEPATWMMMVLGFSAVAAALRRRRRGAEPGWPTEHGLAP